jgi:SAM-dependent methyltransferase
METKTFQDNQNLIGFWDQAFSLSDDEREALRRIEPESWKEMAPSEKLFQAAASLSGRERILDYGCGNAWAGIIAAKSGCPDVTAADPAPGAVNAARVYAAAYGAEKRMTIIHAGPGWLETVPAAAIVADPLLNRFEQAGEEYAAALTLSAETVAALETPMIPKEEYLRNVNGN